ncbi:MAG TPA: DinB family protein [Candidatus Binatia bacterium]|nr:DinB family protein [Candidatus Binatia bacterium]
MKKVTLMGILLLGLGTAGQLAAANPQAKTDQKPTFSGVLDRSLTGIEREIVPAAEAMPDEKFNFAPTQGDFKGVRTFAQQVKHIAAANYMFGAGIMSEKPPLDLGGENGPDNMTSKADIVKFLKDSFAYLHKAVNTVEENNALGEVPSPFGPNKVTRLRLVLIALGHPWDHYGQMVEYLRMNNIIPPASRNQ